MLASEVAGRYLIRDKLDEGGMATVYKAFDTRLNRDVALKIIRRSAFKPDDLAQVLKRFDREARALARLDHPGIVKIHDYGLHEDAPFLVMEYITGGSLKDRLLGQPWPWWGAINFLLPIMRGLEYSHRLGIIHRDVKPSNILITSGGDALLTDFGIAKILDGVDDSTFSTATGVGVGTPEYMAPEQGLGQSVDGRADQYSLGVMLYEMITGRRPFVADTPLATMVQHINTPPPSAQEAIPNLPIAVDRLLMKTLAKDPAARYASLTQLLADAEKILKLQSGRHEPIMRAAPTARSEKRSVSRFGLVAGILVVAALFGAVLFLQPLRAALHLAPTPVGVSTPDIKVLAAAPLPSVAVLPTTTPLATPTAAPTPTPVQILAGDRPVPLSPITVANAESLKLLTRIETGKGVTKILFSPDGSIMAAIHRDGTIQLWDVATSALVNSYRVDGSVSAALFKPNDLLLASCPGTAGCSDQSKSTLTSWQLKPQSIKVVGEYPGVIAGLSPNLKAALRTFMGNTEAIQYANDYPNVGKGKRYRYELWDLSSDPASLLETLGEIVISEGSRDIPIGFSADGTRYCVGCAFDPQGPKVAQVAGSIKIALGEQIYTDLNALRPSSDYSAFVFGSNGIAWLKGHTGPVNDAAFSPDGSLLVSVATDRTARVWSMSAATLLKTLDGHPLDVVAVAFSPNDTLIATAATTGTQVFIWGIAP